MTDQMKLMLRRYVPLSLLHYTKESAMYLFSASRLSKAKKSINDSEDPYSYLSLNELRRLNSVYQATPAQRYDSDTLLLRGRSKANQILRMKGAMESNSFIEIGCGDGMIGYSLSNSGKHVTAIDISSYRFDKRAREAGVKFFEMDASQLEFDNECFDFVFSFDAYEHVSDPKKVLSEALRVLKKGGHLYFEFGPLFYAPYGQHAYHSVKVPYCNLLFTKECMNEYVSNNRLQKINFDEMNEWRLDQYSELFREFGAYYDIEFCYKVHDYSGLEIIERYPSCFKQKNLSFENFITSKVAILLKKAT